MTLNACPIYQFSVSSGYSFKMKLYIIYINLGTFIDIFFIRSYLLHLSLSESFRFLISDPGRARIAKTNSIWPPK